MNPQQLLAVLAQALMREQQARDQLETALTGSQAEVVAAQAERDDALKELAKPPSRRRKS